MTPTKREREREREVSLEKKQLGENGEEMVAAWEKSVALNLKSTYSEQHLIFLLLKRDKRWFIKLLGICKQGEMWGEKQTF